MKAEGKKITLRLPGEVYGALREISCETGLTVNALILLALMRRFSWL